VKALAKNNVKKCESSQELTLRKRRAKMEAPDFVIYDIAVCMSKTGCEVR
jgi:hypothetical protein